MKTLRAYRPKNFGSVVAYYEITAGEKQGSWNPEVLPEIEWVDILVNGKAVDVELYTHFTETFGEKWESNILKDYGYTL